AGLRQIRWPWRIAHQDLAKLLCESRFRDRFRLHGCDATGEEGALLRFAARFLRASSPPAAERAPVIRIRRALASKYRSADRQRSGPKPARDSCTSEFQRVGPFA